MKYRIFHRPKVAAEKLGWGLSTFWRIAKTDPTFPQAYHTTPGTTSFADDELDAYAEQKRGPKREAI
jgi:predicted DNA-binding transcriptional regulator AlpA